MSDIFGKVAAVLLCAWLMFLWPLWQMKEKSLQLERIYLYQQTVEFVDGIRNTGEIRESDFKQFLERVGSMNHRYQAEFTRKRAVDTEALFGENIHTEELKQYFQNEEVYELSYNDFVKIVICDADENMVVCYGGGVKASREEGEDAYEFN